MKQKFVDYELEKTLIDSHGIFVGVTKKFGVVLDTFQLFCQNEVDDTLWFVLNISRGAHDKFLDSNVPPIVVLQFISTELATTKEYHFLIFSHRDGEFITLHPKPSDAITFCEQLSKRYLDKPV